MIEGETSRSMVIPSSAHSYSTSPREWKRLLHNPLWVIASEAKTQFVRIDELDELHVRPEGEGHGWPESIPASRHSLNLPGLKRRLRLLLRNMSIRHCHFDRREKMGKHP